MNLATIFYYIGRVLRVETLFLVPGMLISLFLGEAPAFRGFLITVAVLLPIAFLLGLLSRKREHVYIREGLAIVALSWIVISLFGALPFFLSGAIPDFTDAFFETVSGFTTTGATILGDIEALPTGLLYWRSFTNWLGGMGVLVFFLAIAPRSGQKAGGSYHILQAESPGPTVGKLVPKMRRSAGILYLIYIGLTLLLFVLLLAGNMPVFDSLTTAMVTAGTGGFSVKAASMAAYDSYYLQGVVAVFMTLFAINFNLFYLVLIGEVSKALRNEELRLFLGLIGASVLLITLNTLHFFVNIWVALHHVFFQVSSIISTAGFVTVDFSLWPTFSRCVLLFLMMVGGCAGSTGGGIKVARLLILWKSFKNGLQKQFYPRSVKVARLDGKVLDDGVVKGVNAYMIAYFFLTSLSVMVLALDGLGFETTFSAVVACVNNIGLGMELVGPMDSFAIFSTPGKLVLILDMFIGRLEIFPILILFSPSVWRRSR